MNISCWDVSIARFWVIKVEVVDNGLTVASVMTNAALLEQMLMS